MKKDTWFEQACAKDKVNMADSIARISAWYDENDSRINAYTRFTCSKLSQACETESRRLLSQLKVRAELRAGQPYVSELDMFSDIREGWLLVSRENDNHPLMNARQTFEGRIWHDLTHSLIGANFGFIGETEVYKAQVQHARQYHTAWAQGIDHALYLDIVAQVASGMTYRQFPEQKVF